MLNKWLLTQRLIHRSLLTLTVNVNALKKKHIKAHKNITSSTKMIIKALYVWNYLGTNRTISTMKKKPHIAL